MIIFWVLATIIAVSCTPPCKYHPVLFVPGFVGSQLDAKLNKPHVVQPNCDKTTDEYFTLWLNPELLLPDNIECWVDNMRLVYNKITHTTQNSPGVDIKVIGWGKTCAIENIALEDPLSFVGNYFSAIIDELLNAGYQRSKSLRGVPYDFRKAANEQTEFFYNLKILTEETYKNNNETAILFIAHSMGGCMVRQFLENQDQEWKNTYVRAMVTLGTPWGGSMKMLKTVLEGDKFGADIIDQNAIKVAIRTFPSMAWLLPNSNFWKSDEVLIETDKINFTSKDYKTLFEYIGYETGYEMYLDSLPYTENYSPGVEVHCLYGNKIDTAEKIVYKPGGFPCENPEIQMGNGDGTVNIKSLTGYNQWHTTQKEKVFYEVFDNVNHMRILKDQRTLDYILKLVVVRKTF